MSNRFFVDTPIEDRTVLLSGPEAQHLIKVMRGRVGDSIFLFDGSGHEFIGRIARVDRRQAWIDVVEQHTVDRELPFQLRLAVALPKGDRQRWLVEKLTELGVTCLVPLVTVRGVAQPESNAIVRLQRTVVEASKQCGRNKLMEVAQPTSFSEFLTAVPTDALRLISHPSESLVASPPSQASMNAVAMIGPEGGFTDDEIQQAYQQGWLPLNLGPRVLRVETAAVAAASILGLRQIESSRNPVWPRPSSN